MGKGRPRAVEKGVLGSQNSTSSSSSEASASLLNVPPAPVYYPSVEEFKDPLEYIHKIRNEAERFLKEHCGRKVRKKRVVFEGEDLDMCKLFNAVKRFGGCNKGWHIYCLSPPLKQIPPGNWYCFECLNSDKDSFGFVPGKRYLMEAFRRVADRAKRKWFGSEFASRSQIETKFWEIVEGLAGEVEVMYGSDLDTSVYGSGFPRLNDQRPESVDPESWDEYCASPWNLNNLPKLKGSMLQAVHQNITGVMVPWLYVGMLFSAFCWHFEDHCFYSMNYLHWYAFITLLSEMPNGPVNRTSYNH
ncbi:Lysine-specific demethylase JMJ17 [Linum perenne]